jgi:amino acid adenylation domain-containing protein
MTSVGDALRAGERQAPTLLEQLEEQVRRRPDGLAVEAVGGETLTYAELHRTARGVAASLRYLGIGVGDLVGLSARRNLSLLPALVGILQVGAAYVPVDLADAPTRAQRVLSAAGVRAVLAAGDESVPGGPWTVLPPSGDVVAGDEASVDRSPDDVAYVLFTSGSSGEPKGVVITDANLASYLRFAVREYGFAPGGRTLVHSAVTFDFTVTSLFGPLLTGGTAVVLEEDRPDVLLAQLSTGGFDVVKLTPSHLELVSSQLPASRLASVARLVVVGGEALHVGQLDHWRRAAPHTSFVNEYGPTEATVGCVVHWLRSEDVEGPVPIGRPIPGTRVALVDGSGVAVPPGSLGELVLGGEGVARGYLGRPDLDRSRFSVDPEGIRWYRTGDLARASADGTLVYAGRIDDQVKIRGHRVEPAEVESAMRAVPGVTGAAVVVLPRAAGGVRLVAYVAGVDLTANEVRAELAGALPEWMLPSTVVVLEELPLNVNGKVDRRALPVPDLDRPTLPTTYRPPESPAEIAVCHLWGEVLELAQVGVEDDFFDLGGDSLMAAEVAMRANEELGLPLELGDLFDNPTPRAWLATVGPGR